MITRQNFLRGAALGIAAAVAAPGGRVRAAVPGSAVGLTHGPGRAENTYAALKLIEDEVRAALRGKKRVVIKPNFVNVEKPLCATHADCIEAILEFLGPLTDAEVLIAETPANGPAAVGYDNYGYTALPKSHKVSLKDLDVEGFRVGYLINERHHPVPVRLSTVLGDPNTYVISATRLKTHDRAIVTLGLKNIAVGAILKDVTYTWGKDRKGKSDKPVVHGGPKNEGINYNLFRLADAGYHPHLSVLDGFEGMEGNGPVGGTPVDHHVAVASTDWLAADVTGATLMGFDPAKIGYLSFASAAGMGQGDVAALDVRGEKIADHIRAYRPHERIAEQLNWM